MKHNFKKIALVLGTVCSLMGSAQITTETFDTFTLTSQGYYKDTLGTDWQNSQAVFRYDWTYTATSTYTASYWSSGSAYTNLSDTAHGDYSHLYNCRAGSGYNHSPVYVTAQPGAIIAMKTSGNMATMVSGFYVTNTTYAYKSMRNGDSFAKKFGGTTGNDPDWFKLLVYAYRGGALTADSVEFYLADYRPSDNSQDYIVEGWEWVDCSILGAADSLTFALKSSDTGPYGMNTPAFFSFDNFTTSPTVGIHELTQISELRLFPNPATDKLNISFTGKETSDLKVAAYNVIGTEVYSATTAVTTGENHIVMDIASLSPGVYMLEMSTGTQAKKLKFIKQ